MRRCRSKANFDIIAEMNSPEKTKGRIAGIDYGHVRIGVAISDPMRTIASPLANYARRDAAQDARFFRDLVKNEELKLFVVGLPVHLDGTESQKSIEARNFGKWLQETTGLPVAFCDERFTSREADQWLAMAEMTKKQKKNRRDMLAAQIMLAAYLEAPDACTEAPRSISDDD